MAPAADPAAADACSLEELGDDEIARASEGRLHDWFQYGKRPVDYSLQKAAEEIQSLRNLCRSVRAGAAKGVLVPKINARKALLELQRRKVTGNTWLVGSL